MEKRLDPYIRWHRRGSQVQLGLLIEGCVIQAQFTADQVSVIVVSRDYRPEFPVRDVTVETVEHRIVKLIVEKEMLVLHADLR